MSTDIETLSSKSGIQFNCKETTYEKTIRFYPYRIDDRSCDVAILAAIALPAYNGYTAKAKYSEAITAGGGLKDMVEMCYSDLNTKTGCTNEKSGSGWSIKKSTDYARGIVSEVTVTDGTIVVKSANGTGAIADATYTLTPTVVAGVGLKWAVACSNDDLCDDKAG